MTNTKQLKITKLFRKGGGHQHEDCDEIEAEIQQLEQKLEDAHNEWLQLQRHSYKRKWSPAKSKIETYDTPQQIICNNSVEHLKRKIELLYMLTGMQVQSYIPNDHCCIIYHLQHDTEQILKHGLRIDMQPGSNEITKSSLPFGFNLGAVLEDFDSIMMPDCHNAIRKALVAYYCRLEQYESLKKLLITEAQLFKTVDGSHIQISFMAQSDMEEDDENINVVLMLDYRVYDIRPKTFSFKEIDLPEGAAELLREQCSVFKKKPLHKAFKQAFIDGDGQYKLSQQVRQRRQEPQRRRRHKRPNPHYNNDDTFHPEECSDASDDDQQSEN
ncbi:hypothetical protein evm_003342 [Chilo suppressalis]|nr:hypothetical protein evm_003342 [Chilo suppressalis]